MIMIEDWLVSLEEVFEMSSAKQSIGSSTVEDIVF